MFSCGKRGDKLQEFDHPLYICSSQTGLLYVADSFNDCIKVIDEKSGKVVQKYACSGDKDGQIREPRGVCVDIFGNIYVVDSGNERISMFDNKGIFIKQVLKGIPSAYACAVGSEGLFALTSTDGMRVYKLPVWMTNPAEDVESAIEEEMKNMYYEL